jgi:hypothetical protein
MKKNALGLSLIVSGMLFVWAPPIPIDAQAQQKPTVPMPQPGVPQIMTIEASFVRAAYNDEGYVILSYEPVQRSIGEQWVLLDIGITVRDRVPAFDLTRESLSLETPDGKTLPLPSESERRAGNTSALENRARVQRDSINYFPPSATRACRIGFFADLNSRVMAWDKVEVSNTRACLGRIFFHVPGGITYGQHWLNVKFPKSLVRVPFRILTKDEEKFLNKNYKSIRQQVEDAFKKKK